jgi:cytoskeletal protein CcmA (bactofilin family)
VQSNVEPSANNAYDLGSSSLRWANVYGVNGDFSTVTVSGLTPGSVIFAGTGGALSQNNAKFFWDNGNERLGIGTNAPAATLHVVGTGRFDGQLTVTTGGAAITGNSTVTGTLGVSSDVSVGGNLTVDGNTTLGNNAAVDLVTFNARVQSNVEPSANNAYDLGSSSLRWANVYGVNGDFSTVTVSGLTPGSVIFAGTGGALSQNNAKFFWDNGNERLGIGTNTPAATLHVVGTGRFDGQLTVTTGGAAITGNSTVTGTLGVSSDVSVGGNLTVDGNTTLGNNAAVDLVTFNARVQSNVEPSANNAYDLGSRPWVERVVTPAVGERVRGQWGLQHGDGERVDAGVGDLCGHGWGIEPEQCEVLLGQWQRAVGHWDKHTGGDAACCGDGAL